MHTTVEKFTVRFGIAQGDPAGNGAWAGAPLARQSALPIGGSGIVLAGSTIPDLDVLTRYTNAPRKGTSDGPIRAIEIAADSPIECVDFMIAGEGGDSDRHRIAVGAPFIGDLSEIDHLKFAPITPTPFLGFRNDNVLNGGGGSMQAAQFNAETLVWDAAMDSIGFGNLIGKVFAAPLLPVRFKLYRGDVSPLGAVRTRGPYAASALWKIVDRGDGQPTSPCLVVITDGRRRVRWTVGQKNPGTASFAVDGIQGYKALESAGDFTVNGRVDLPSFDPLIAATALAAANAHTPSIFDWNGNPYFAMRVVITGAIGDAGYIDCKAYDA